MRLHGAGLIGSADLSGSGIARFAGLSKGLCEGIARLGSRAGHLGNEGSCDLLDLQADLKLARFELRLLGLELLVLCFDEVLLKVLLIS